MAEDTYDDEGFRECSEEEKEQASRELGEYLNAYAHRIGAVRRDDQVMDWALCGSAINLETMGTQVRHWLASSNLPAYQFIGMVELTKLKIANDDY